MPARLGGALQQVRYARRKVALTEKGADVDISVIIPVYNERNTILEVVQRVQKQPFDKEIIIVDDCSTDGTTAILKETDWPENVQVYFHAEEHG